MLAVAVAERRFALLTFTWSAGSMLVLLTITIAVAIRRFAFLALAGAARAMLMLLTIAVAVAKGWLALLTGAGTTGTVLITELGGIGQAGLGFMLPPALSLAAPPRCFGHPGAGGSLGLADPDAGIAIGYVMNQMQFGLTGDPRSQALVEAVYASIR